MPLQYSSVLIEAVSQTDDLEDIDLKVIHGAEVLINAISQADGQFLGRDRHSLPYTAISSAALAAYPLIRRYSSVLCFAETQAFCNLLSVTPAIPTPSGALFLDGKQLNSQRLPKRASHTFGFTVSGKRLDGLTVTFILEDLNNRPLLKKTILINPGGVSIEEIVTDANGRQTATGWVILLPRDTAFEREELELECKYILEIGNSSTRKHILEVGYCTFFDT